MLGVLEAFTVYEETPESSFPDSFQGMTGIFQVSMGRPNTSESPTGHSYPVCCIVPDYSEDLSLTK